jgi:periplasmic protein TonB
MFADRQQKAQAQSVLSRSGPALAVIGIHVVLIYLISASMGIVPIPTFKPPMDAVFIEDTESKPEPAPVIEPEIEIPTQNIEQPLPEEIPIAPPIEVDLPVQPSGETAIAAQESAQPPGQVQDLKATQRVEPVYPSASRRGGEEGTVRLRVLVDERGRPRDVQLAQSSGFPRLDDAAMDAVRRWRFQAASDGTNAISAWTQVAVSFKLTDGKR